LYKQGGFFTVIYLISVIFLWREIAEYFWTQLEQVKNDPFERGCR
jgi:hypothetical protein